MRVWQAQPSISKMSIGSDWFSFELSTPNTALILMRELSKHCHLRNTYADYNLLYTEEMMAHRYLSAPSVPNEEYRVADLLLHWANWVWQAKSKEEGGW